MNWSQYQNIDITTFIFTAPNTVLAGGIICLNSHQTISSNAAPFKSPVIKQNTAVQLPMSPSAVVSLLDKRMDYTYRQAECLSVINI